MSHGTVELFRRTLDTFNISDFHGLISPGLTCYLNSVLQVLFMTEKFRDKIKRTAHQSNIDKPLDMLFTNLEKDKARTHDLIHILGIGDVYEQRDAAEYFEKILRLTNPKSSKMFRGELNHITKCCKCKEISNSAAFFWILPLSIKDPDQTYGVDQGLKDFFRKEKVSRENKMFCTKCDKKQDAIIMCEMTTPPDVLTLLLKRFHFDYDLMCNVKVECEAEVPHTLQIKGCTYELYAMIKHYGNLSGGHYIAIIFSFQTKEWYSFNDESVKLVKNFLGSGRMLVRSRSCYLLMYMKRSKDSENTSENQEEPHSTTPDAEDELMEAHRTKYRDPKAKGQVDYMYNQYKLTESHETDSDTVRRLSPMSQRRLNSPRISKSKASHTEVDSMMHNQDTLSIQQISRWKCATTFSNVHTNNVSPNKLIKSTKGQMSKPWK